MIDLEAIRQRNEERKSDPHIDENTGQYCVSADRPEADIDALLAYAEWLESELAIEENDQAGDHDIEVRRLELRRNYRG